MSPVFRYLQIILLVFRLETSKKNYLPVFEHISILTPSVSFELSEHAQRESDQKPTHSQGIEV